MNTLRKNKQSDTLGVTSLQENTSHGNVNETDNKNLNFERKPYKGKAVTLISDRENNRYFLTLREFRLTEMFSYEKDLHNWVKLNELDLYIAIQMALDEIKEIKNKLNIVKNEN